MKKMIAVFVMAIIVASNIQAEEGKSIPLAITLNLIIPGAGHIYNGSIGYGVATFYTEVASMCYINYRISEHGVENQLWTIGLYVDVMLKVQSTMKLVEIMKGEVR